MSTQTKKEIFWRNIEKSRALRAKTSSPLDQSIRLQTSALERYHQREHSEGMRRFVDSLPVNPSPFFHQGYSQHKAQSTPNDNEWGFPRTVSEFEHNATKTRVSSLGKWTAT